tara:strand:- start:151 stop:591 length:441 start_codon:yes stop_codon:yes gene_type:complete
MAKFKDNILAFTDEEALNQEVAQSKWEVIKKVWGKTANLSATPPVYGYSSSDEDDSTIHLDVTDCSSLNTYAWGTWFGIFSDAPIIIGVNSGVGANTYNTGNMMKRSWFADEFIVPKGAKYFNYRMSDYGTGQSEDKHYTIVVLKQ